MSDEIEKLVKLVKKELKTSRDIIALCENALEIIAEGTLSEHDMRVVAQVTLDTAKAKLGGKSGTKEG